MKLSKYTIFVEDEGHSIVYNTAHNALMICTPDTERIIREHIETIDELEKIHPTLYNYMKNKGFIIPDNTNEMQEVIASIRKELDDDEEYSITINPTMNCNLRCWYCYEDHLANSNMSDQVLASVEKLLVNVTDNPRVKSLHLSFFGGEPLLGFRKCVKPLLDFANERCLQQGVDFSISFTSNAVLLTEEICDALSRFGRTVSFQIPFDGSREIHDSIKKTFDGKGTYDKTLANLKYALTKGFHITVRCNYTRASAASFRKLVDDIKPLLVSYRSQIRVSFQQVWQDMNHGKDISVIEEMENEIAAIGGAYYCSGADTNYCYADRKNSFVINYNGDVFQCTARNFTNENKDGELRSDGTICYNDRYYRRMDSRFSNPECTECKLYPICGVCTQKRLEHGNERCIGACFKNYKTDLLLQRIKSLYRISQEAKKGGSIDCAVHVR